MHSMGVLLHSKSSGELEVLGPKTLNANRFDLTPTLPCGVIFTAKAGSTRPRRPPCRAAMAGLELESFIDAAAATGVTRSFCGALGCRRADGLTPCPAFSMPTKHGFPSLFYGVLDVGGKRPGGGASGDVMRSVR